MKEIGFITLYDRQWNIYIPCCYFLNPPRNMYITLNFPDSCVICTYIGLLLGHEACNEASIVSCIMHWVAIRGFKERPHIINKIRHIFWLLNNYYISFIQRRLIQGKLLWYVHCIYCICITLLPQCTYQWVSFAS